MILARRAIGGSELKRDRHDQGKDAEHKHERHPEHRVASFWGAGIISHW